MQSSDAAILAAGFDAASASGFDYAPFLHHSPRVASFRFY
jgi:hypothetical protein